MKRQAYIAELTQLLYYMTPWDREAAIEKYDKLLADAEDVEALVAEIGSPMKLAVTLSRGYEASPKPGPNTPKPAPAPKAADIPPVEPEPEETPAAVGETEEIPAEDTPKAEAEPEPEAEPEVNTEDAKADAEDIPEADVSDAAPESEAVEIEVEVVEISTGEPEAASEPEPEPKPIPEAAPVPHKVQLPARDDGIFSEIFAAATEAQSPVTMETTAKRRSPRPTVLIPFVILSILLGVPVALVLLAVDLLIFALALTALVGGIFLLVFTFSSGFTGLGNHLTALGLVILGITVSVALAALGIWFMQNAVTGFVGFLVQFGQEHGYHEEGAL